MKSLGESDYYPTTLLGAIQLAAIQWISQCMPTPTMYIILLHPSSTLHQVLAHIRAITPLLHAFVWSDLKKSEQSETYSVLTVVTTFEIWPSRGECLLRKKWPMNSKAKQRGGRKQSKAGGGGSFQWIVKSAAELSKFMHYSFKEPSNSENEKWYI